MLDIINAFIYGIIQGLTEFLPVSSSGHLVILHNFFNSPMQSELAFDTVLHLASLMAVIWFFRKEIKKLIVSWIKSLAGIKDEYSRLGWLIIISTIPAALAGYFFENMIETVLRSNYIVVIMLIFVGLLFLAIEKYAQGGLDNHCLNWKKALLIGCAQAISLIPGTSRSGITIIAGMSAGLRRVEAVRYSFLMSVPIILGASIKKLPDLFNELQKGHIDIGVIGLAFITTFITAVFAIKFLLDFTRNYKLNSFAYYRFVLAGLVLVFILSHRV